MLTLQFSVLTMCRSVDDHSPYNLFIFYNRLWQCLWLNLFIFRIMVSLQIYIVLMKLCWLVYRKTFVYNLSHTTRMDHNDSMLLWAIIPIDRSLLNLYCWVNGINQFIMRKQPHAVTVSVNYNQKSGFYNDHLFPFLKSTVSFVR